MSEYIDPGSQLVVEIYVSDIKRSIEFYRSFGFELVRDDGNFVELKWEQSFLFLEQVRDAPAAERSTGNIRIMVPDVDRYWELALSLGVEVTRPIQDRYYGLRDFSIAGPDGLSLRFATRLTETA